MAKGCRYKNFLELAKNRLTNFEFSREKIPEKDLKDILEAARWAPSAANAQPWKFIVVKNNTTIRKLMDSCYYGFFRSDPPVIIALVIPKEIYSGGSHRVMKNGTVGSVEAHLCIAMPALNMCFQAENAGLASALLTPNEQIAAKLLALRKGDRLPIIVGIGHYDESKPKIMDNHQRHPLSELVYFEKMGKRR